MKLVRDRIPEIIIEDGRTPIYHIADKEEYKRELFRKVEEELAEFLIIPNALFWESIFINFIAKKLSLIHI